MDKIATIKSKPIILAVDDSQMDLYLLQQLLDGEGYSIQTVFSGRRAIQFVEHTIPDLLLIDIRMPEMDGFELCRRVKNIPTCRDIPVIFLSRMEHSSYKVEAFAAGGVDFIQKPFIAEELIARLDTHLTLRHLQIGLEEKVAERTRELIYSSEVQKLLTKLSTDFIALPVEEIDPAINRALQEVGSFVHARQFSINIYSDDKSTFSRVYEWVPAGGESTISKIQNIPVEVFGWIRDKALRGENFILTDISELTPENEILLPLLSSLGAASALGIPLISNDAVIGFVSIYLADSETAVSKDTINLLQIISQIFVNALQRKQSEAALIKSNYELIKLQEISTAALQQTSIDDFITKIHNIFSDLLYTTDMMFLLYDKDNHRLINRATFTHGSLLKHIEQLANINVMNFAPILKDGYRYYQALKSGQGFITSDLKEIGSLYAEFTNKKSLHKFIKPILRLLNVQHSGVVPLVTTEEPLGLIVFNTKRSFSDEYLQRLNRAGAQTALALSRILAVQTIRASEERLSGILELALDGVISMNEDFQITLFNQGAENIFGYTAAEILGKPLESLIPARYNLAHKQHIARLGGESANLSRKRNERTDVELFGLRKDGQEFLAEISISKLNMDEKIIYTAIVRDITKRKQTEKTLLESEKRYRNLVENTSDIVYRMELTPERRYSYISPSVTRILGYTPEEHYADPDLGVKFVFPDDLILLEGLFVEGNMGKPWTIRWVRKDGRIIWVESKNIAIYDNEGNVIAIEGIARDITERKEAELELQRHQDNLEKLVEERTAALQKSEARYRTVVEDQTDFISRWKPDGTITFVNDRYCKLFDRSRGELIGNNIFDMMSTKAKQKVKERIAHITLEQPTYTAEYQSNSEERNGRWFQWIERGIHDEDGKLIVIQSVGSDITERKRVEEFLRRSEQRFRAIVQDQTEFLIRYLPDATLSFVNDSYCQYMGASFDALIGTNLLDKLSDVEKKRILKKVTRFTLDEPVFTEEYYKLFPDGKERWENWTDRGIFDENGKLVEIQAIGRDITQRKLSERDLHLRDAALKAAANAMAITDVNGDIIWVNPAFTQLTGYTLEEVVGKNSRILKSGQHESGFYKNIWDTVLSGNVWHSEIINKHKDGTLYTEEMIITPVRNGIGVISHFVAVKHDITARKLAEKELRQRTKELETFNKIMVDREMRIIEMKEEVNQLCKELGREVTYPPIWQDSAEEN